MALQLIPPPNGSPISTGAGSLTQSWGGWFTLMYNILQSGTGLFAPSTASYILNVADETGSLTQGQVLGSLSSGFVKVTTGTGLLASTGSSQIRSSDIAITGVTPGTYTVNGQNVMTVNAEGQVTSAGNVSITGLPPTGVAGGDLTGNYPNPLLIVGHTYNINISGSASTATTASTVTTNANLTGPVTSVGNATSITPGSITNTMLHTPVIDLVSYTFFGGL